MDLSSPLTTTATVIQGVNGHLALIKDGDKSCELLKAKLSSTLAGLCISLPELIVPQPASRLGVGEEGEVWVTHMKALEGKKKIAAQFEQVLAWA